ncbi:MAG: viroplasmin family protein [Candidatus Woesearchaeota archaeon]
MLYYPTIVEGELKGIFTSWDECKEYVHGIKGKKFYKKTNNIEEVIRLLRENGATDEDIKIELDKNQFAYNESIFKENVNTNVKSSNKSKKEIIEIKTKDKYCAYVDGSYNKKTNTYGYGLVIVYNNEIVYEENDSGNDAEVARMFQVGGELLGATRAIAFAVENGFEDIIVFYDYKGIECWANEDWRTKKLATIKYKKDYDMMKKLVNIKFVKVKAHVKKSERNFHNNMNERADQLAKEAVGI